VVSRRLILGYEEMENADIDEYEEGFAGYKRYVSTRVLFIALSFFFLLSVALFSIAVGPVYIPIYEVIATLLGNGAGNSPTIIWNIRIPQVLTGIVAGVGLAIAGASLQTILRNPLGSPFTLGISHAAAFGAAFAIIVLGAGTLQSSATGVITLNNPYIITLSAFMWSLVSTLVIFLLARYKGASPEVMILTGIALGSLFIAGLTALEYFADQVQLASIIFWSFGDIARATWRDLWIMVTVIIPASLYFILNGWNYNALDSGDEMAKSLGVNVERIRLHGLIIASLITALVTSFVGIIGFVGLVVPHIVRKLIGGDELFLMPSSCLIGGLLLLTADTAARTVIAPIILPVGILTSFLGAPLFIYLVLRGREYW